MESMTGTRRRLLRFSLSGELEEEVSDGPGRLRICGVAVVDLRLEGEVSRISDIPGIWRTAGVGTSHGEGISYKRVEIGQKCMIKFGRTFLSVGTLLEANTPSCPSNLLFSLENGGMISLPIGCTAIWPMFVDG